MVRSPNCPVSLDDLLTKLKVAKTKKLAVAVAQDEPVLEAVKAAKDRGIADAILVGDREKIEAVATKIDMDLSSFEIVHEDDVKKAFEIRKAEFENPKTKFIL